MTGKFSFYPILS